MKRSLAIAEISRKLARLLCIACLLSMHAFAQAGGGTAGAASAQSTGSAAAAKSNPAPNANPSGTPAAITNAANKTAAQVAGTKAFNDAIAAGKGASAAKDAAFDAALASGRNSGVEEVTAELNAYSTADAAADTYAAGLLTAAQVAGTKAFNDAIAAGKGASAAKDAAFDAALASGRNSGVEEVTAELNAYSTADAAADDFTAGHKPNRTGTNQASTPSSTNAGSTGAQSTSTTGATNSNPAASLTPEQAADNAYLDDHAGQTGFRADLHAHNAAFTAAKEKGATDAQANIDANNAQTLWNTNHPPSANDEAAVAADNAYLDDHAGQTGFRADLHAHNAAFTAAKEKGATDAQANIDANNAQTLWNTNHPPSANDEAAVAADNAYLDDHAGQTGFRADLHAHNAAFTAAKEKGATDAQANIDANNAQTLWNTNHPPSANDEAAVAADNAYLDDHAGQTGFRADLHAHNAAFTAAKEKGATDAQANIDANNAQTLWNTNHPPSANDEAAVAADNAYLDDHAGQTGFRADLHAHNAAFTAAKEKGATDAQANIDANNAQTLWNTNHPPSANDEAAVAADNAYLDDHAGQTGFRADLHAHNAAFTAAKEKGATDAQANIDANNAQTLWNTNHPSSANANKTLTQISNDAGLSNTTGVTSNPTVVVYGATVNVPPGTSWQVTKNADGTGTVTFTTDTGNNRPGTTVVTRDPTSGDVSVTVTKNGLLDQNASFTQSANGTVTTMANEGNANSETVPAPQAAQAAGVPNGQQQGSANPDVAAAISAGAHAVSTAATNAGASPAEASALADRFTSSATDGIQAADANGGATLGNWTGGPGTFAGEVTDDVLFAWALKPRPQGAGFTLDPKKKAEEDARSNAVVDAVKDAAYTAGQKIEAVYIQQHSALPSAGQSGQAQQAPAQQPSPAAQQGKTAVPNASGGTPASITAKQATGTGTNQRSTPSGSSSAEPDVRSSNVTPSTTTTATVSSTVPAADSHCPVGQSCTPECQIGENCTSPTVGCQTGQGCGSNSCVTDQTCTPAPCQSGQNCSEGPLPLTAAAKPAAALPDKNYFQGLASSGVGKVTVGVPKGYELWHNADGSFDLIPPQGQSYHITFVNGQPVYSPVFYSIGGPAISTSPSGTGVGSAGDERQQTQSSPTHAGLGNVTPVLPSVNSLTVTAPRTTLQIAIDAYNAARAKNPLRTPVAVLEARNAAFNAIYYVDPNGDAARAAVANAAADNAVTAAGENDLISGYDDPGQGFGALASKPPQPVKATNEAPTEAGPATTNANSSTENNGGKPSGAPPTTLTAGANPAAALPDKNYFQGLASSGVGKVTVGVPKGYELWHNADGSFDLIPPQGQSYHITFVNGQPVYNPVFYSIGSEPFSSLGGSPGFSPTTGTFNLTGLNTYPQGSPILKVAITIKGQNVAVDAITIQIAQVAPSAPNAPAQLPSTTGPRSAFVLPRMDSSGPALGSDGSLQLASFHTNDPLEASLSGALAHVVPRSRPDVRSNLQAASQAPSFNLVANGKSSGEAFEFQVFDPRGKLKEVRVPDGLILEPIERGAAKPVSAGPGQKTSSHKLSAFCVNFEKEPPEPDQLFRVASPEIQEQYKPVRAVIRAGRELSEAGKFHPDSDPKAYADSIRQYALWTSWKAGISRNSPTTSSSEQRRTRKHCT